MDSALVNHLEAAIEHAQVVDSMAVEGNVSRQFLQILKNESGEVVVQGNSEGLIHLALSLLRLAKKDVGAHVHFDEAGIVDYCDVALVVTRCAADWEK